MKSLPRVMPAMRCGRAGCEHQDKHHSTNIEGIPCLVRNCECKAWQRPWRGPGSGNHARFTLVQTVLPYADTLRACATEEEVTNTLLWLIKNCPNASAGTRKKWHKVAEKTTEAIRVRKLRAGVNALVVPQNVGSLLVLP